MRNNTALTFRAVFCPRQKYSSTPHNFDFLRFLVEKDNARVTLEENCISPSRALVNHGRIIFHCAREQAGKTLLHSTLVFRVVETYGNTTLPRAKKDECRNDGM